MRIVIIVFFMLDLYSNMLYKSSYDPTTYHNHIDLDCDHGGTLSRHDGMHVITVHVAAHCVSDASNPAAARW
jgi:hypothetical protein